jgi:hypothetical protein
MEAVKDKKCGQRKETTMILSRYFDPEPFSFPSRAGRTDTPTVSTIRMKAGRAGLPDWTWLTRFA